MRLLQCLAKEAPRSGRIALAAQKEIDRLPSLSRHGKDMSTTFT